MSIADYVSEQWGWDPAGFSDEFDLAGTVIQLTPLLRELILAFKGPLSFCRYTAPWAADLDPA